MGKFGDGKLKDNELYLDEKTKNMLAQVKDPKMLKKIQE